MVYPIRTDLALEARELWHADGNTHEPDGVTFSSETDAGFRVETVRVLNEQGSKALCKPIGEYVTISLEAYIRREEDAFGRAARLLGKHLGAMLGSQSGPVLVAGLGNAAITPDALGPWCLQHVLVTRHLTQQLPEQFGAFRSVAALQTGVLGTTGVESAELVAAVCRQLKPSAVIAVDALASRSVKRLCRTVQIADSGVIPGSGVGNRRLALNRDELGIPVIALGVPTVVDAATLSAELAEQTGTELNTEKLPRGLIVTPRDIDQTVRDAAKLIGYGIDLALNPSLSVEDVDMFLS